MTYEEFENCVSVTPTYGFLRHDLRKVDVSFRMWADANYTEARKAEMTEDEFIDWAIRMLYEKVTTTKPFACKVKEDAE